MNKVCAWCGVDMSPGRDETLPVSHGICEACRQMHFPEVVQTQSVERFLNRLDAPVMLVDWDVNVLSVNDKAKAALGRQFKWLPKLRGGDVLGCTSKDGAGCGRSADCEGCVIRNSVTHTYLTGEPKRKVEALREISSIIGTKKRLRLAITTEKVRDVVLLRIDELEETPE